jgi:hypothetical protein
LNSLFWLSKPPSFYQSKLSKKDGIERGHFANPFPSFPDFFANFLQVNLMNENRSKNFKIREGFYSIKTPSEPKNP